MGRAEVAAVPHLAKAMTASHSKMHPHPLSFCQNVVNQPSRYAEVTLKMWIHVLVDVCPTHRWISEVLVLLEEIVTLTVVMDQRARGSLSKKASRYFWANFSCKGPH